MMVYEAGQNREGGRGAPGGRVVGLWDVLVEAPCQIVSGEDPGGERRG